MVTMATMAVTNGARNKEYETRTDKATEAEVTDGNGPSFPDDETGWVNWPVGWSRGPFPCWEDPAETSTERMDGGPQLRRRTGADEVPRGDAQHSTAARP